jgi:superfamily II DNA or RNA helicase
MNLDGSLVEPPSLFETYGDVVERAAVAHPQGLRPFQPAIATEACAAFAAGRYALAVLPTGCGKSGIATLVPYYQHAHRVLVVAPSVVMAVQIAVDFCGSAGWTGTDGDKPFVCSIMSDGNARIVSCPPQGTVMLKTVDLRNARPFTHLSLVVVNAQKFGVNVAQVQVQDADGAHSVDMHAIDSNAFDLIIVDEAHHYPAHTWQRIGLYFANAKILFMTATPHGLEAVSALQGLAPLNSSMNRADAIRLGYIRELQFMEVESEEAVLRRIIEVMQHHDGTEPALPHKAMIMVHRVSHARLVQERFNALAAPLHWTSQTFVQRDTTNRLKDFTDNRRPGYANFRCLIVSGRLIEGFSHKPISVVGILRKIGRTRRVLFTQFVGRAVRVTPVTLVGAVVSEVQFRQGRNFENFVNPQRIALVDPVDDGFGGNDNGEDDAEIEDENDESDSSGADDGDEVM